MAVKARRRLTQAQRLDLLEREHEAALDKIASAMFGQANRAEVRFRTAENARARRQAAGVTRSGRRSGATGRKSRTRISVKEEQRREAERVVDGLWLRSGDAGDGGSGLRSGLKAHTLEPWHFNLRGAP